MPSFHGLFLRLCLILFFGTYSVVSSFTLTFCVCFYVLGGSPMSPGLEGVALCRRFLVGPEKAMLPLYLWFFVVWKWYAKVYFVLFQVFLAYILLHVLWASWICDFTSVTNFTNGKILCHYFKKYVFCSIFALFSISVCYTAWNCPTLFIGCFILFYSLFVFSVFQFG